VSRRSVDSVRLDSVRKRVAVLLLLGLLRHATGLLVGVRLVEVGEYSGSVE
jgi:hypothetical protein